MRAVVCPPLRREVSVRASRMSPDTLIVLDEGVGHGRCCELVGALIS